LVHHFVWPSVGLAFALIAAGPAKADTLDDVRRRGVLRWGADQEGGGPYVYPDPADPARVVGFEVELMEMLAGQLGVRAEFCQGEWTTLPQQLRRGDIDLVVNGYELTAPRLEEMLASIPYYVYELQLLARQGDAEIQSWDDLKAPGRRKKVIGVLSGSGAETYTRERLGDAVEIQNGYSGATDAMADVRNGRLDATVQDLPAPLFYRNRFPELRFVGEPVGRGYYVIYLRKGDDRLREALDAGILDLLNSGRLRALYERYGLWNAAQKQLGEHVDVQETSRETRGWAAVSRHLPALIRAAGITIELTCLAMPLAIVLGLAIALVRLYGPAPLGGLLGAYVEVIRGTPLFVQLFTIYYVLPPAFGIRLPPLTAAVLGLGLNYAAYEAEIYRAGLLAIPRGQMDAALALGMAKWTALRRIIVPQAVRLVIPPVTNDFIALFKDTSICSMIAVVELAKEYSILVNSTNAHLELAAVVALLYLLMSYPLARLARRLERQGPRLAA
jgi:polar amino acid transport system substrate-binding protein